jgi:hypothetical protein
MIINYITISIIIPDRKLTLTKIDKEWILNDFF